MNNFTSIQNNLLCTISSHDHILRDPRKLPCKRTACLNCIENLAETNHKFNCKFCKQSHDTLKDLVRNFLCEDALDDNLNNLSKHEANRLNLVSKSTQLLFSGTQNAIDGLFEFYKYEIEIRFESLRAALDLSANDVLNKLEFVLNEGLNEFEKSLKEVDIKSPNRSLLESERIFHKLSDIGMHFKKESMYMVDKRILFSKFYFKKIT